MFRILSHQFVPLHCAIDIKAESNAFGYSMKHRLICEFDGASWYASAVYKHSVRKLFRSAALSLSILSYPPPHTNTEPKFCKASIKERKTLFIDNTLMKGRKYRNEPPFPNGRLKSISFDIFERAIYFNLVSQAEIFAVIIVYLKLPFIWWTFRILLFQKLKLREHTNKPKRQTRRRTEFNSKQQHPIHRKP